ncbi:MAG: hypothetical protein WDN25_09745 [Acetobacteraceae bacterium]
MKTVALALLLAGCSVATPDRRQAMRPVIPAELQSCPLSPAAIQPPATPRTFEAVIAWARQVEIRRVETVQALEVCRGRLIRRHALAARG